MRYLLTVLVGLSLLRSYGAGAAPLPPPPDSLRAALQAAPAGRGRAAVLLRILRAVNGETPDSVAVLRYADAAIRLGRQLGDSIIVGQGIDGLGAYHVTQQHYGLAAARLREAERLLQLAPVNARAVNAFHLAQLYGSVGKALQARRYYWRANIWFEKAHNVAGQLLNLNELSLNFNNENRYDSAIYCLLRAARISHRLGRKADEGLTLGNLLDVCYERGDVAQAAYYGRQAYALSAAAHDTLNMAMTLSGMARLMQRRDSSAQGLRYIQQQLGLLRRAHLNVDLVYAYTNLAALYRNLNTLDSARFYYQRTVGLAEQQRLPASDLGTIYANLSNFYLQQQDLAQAKRWADQALHLPRLVGIHPDYIPGALDILRQIAERQHNYPLAYQRLQDYDAVVDSIRHRNNNRIGEDLRVAYEVEKTEQQVLLLTQDQELGRLRRQREWAGGLGLFALTLGSGGWGLRRYRRRQRGRETALRTRLAADLHDDVGSLLTQISLESSWLKAGRRTPEQLAPHLEHLAEASRRAVQQLSDVVWGIDARNDATQPLLERLRDHAHETLSVAGLDIDFAADPALTAVELPLLTRQNLYLIYKEALHNAVKHAQASLITVRLSLADNVLTMRIQDDGRGYAGTGRPGGQGLANMKLRAGACGGTATYEQQGNGFGVVVTLPV